MMKNILILAALMMTMMSCDKDKVNIDETVKLTAQTDGEWQMYRDENLESVIDEWIDGAWTMKDQWFRNLRDDSEIILQFKEDGTFVNRYADVVTASGVYGTLSDGRVYFDYNQEDIDINDKLPQRSLITFYCDNTFSVEVEGNERAVYYYKAIDTAECGDLITYKVED